MKVVLTKHQQKYIQDRVRSGHYADPSELIREALRYHEIMQTNGDWLEQQIQEGIDSPGIPFTKEFKRKWMESLQREREERRRKKAA